MKLRQPLPFTVLTLLVAAPAYAQEPVVWGRVEYGNDLLDLLEQGVAPQEAMDQVVAADEGRSRRQVGVIDLAGRSAQWTGSDQYGAEDQGDWVSERANLRRGIRDSGLPQARAVCGQRRVSIEGDASRARVSRARLARAVYRFVR